MPFICNGKNSSHQLNSVLVFVFFFIWICGLAQLTLGGIIVADENKGVSRFTNFPVGGFTIAVGSLQFLVCLLICGVRIRLGSEHYPCILLTYVLLLLLFCLLQSILASFALSTIRDDNGDVTKEAQKVVTDLFKHYADDKHDKKLIDNFQSEFKCCGVFNHTEWYDSPIRFVPMSCCPENTISRCAGDAYKKGCAETFQDIIATLCRAIGGIAIAFAIIEIAAAEYAWIIRNRVVRLKAVPNQAQSNLVNPVSNTWNTEAE